MDDEEDDAAQNHQSQPPKDNNKNKDKRSSPAQQKQQKKPPEPKRRTRTRTGCLNCRRKKRKCDERRPACGACHRRNQHCEWGLKVSFRAENAQHIDVSHPSMKRMAKKQRPREFEILDVTSEVIRDYLSSPAGDGDVSMIAADAAVEPTPPNGVIKNKPWRNHGASNYGDKYASPAASTPGTIQPNTAGMDNSLQSPVITNGPSPNANRHADSAVASLLYLSQGGQPTDTMAVDSVNMDLGNGYGPIQGFTPEGLEDGIFLPGSAYHEWHSTLRNHLIQEVKSNAPTRAATPLLEPDRDHLDSDAAGPEIPRSHHHIDDAASDSELAFISKIDECKLWRNWFDEIAPWLDKFDNERHFQHIIPTMAADHAHLRLSILALSARQIELQATNSPTDHSLALYQEAIHLLLPHLPSRSTAVIASCLILCVLEMLSCSPKAWQRHLDGCASLMEAVGINGFVGGVEQALFWCFARMDVCGGLISSVKTLIPVSTWASKIDISSDTQHFEGVKDFTGWSNYSVYLIAQVIDLLMPPTPTRPDTQPTTSRNSSKFRSRWIELWKCLCEWHDRRPAPLLPVMTIASSASSPFPTILFSNPAAISGNQLHHTASLLMLQNLPPGYHPTPKPRSILWHARRVCAISISNNHHGAWTNAIQPLWIAGRCMSNPAEHRAILDLLERIEKESGWGTRWRADDLRAFWGDLE